MRAFLLYCRDVIAALLLLFIFCSFIFGYWVIALAAYIAVCVACWFMDKDDVK